MRLIDADKLKYQTDEDGFRYIMAYEVNSTPTIPAIPVDWILTYRRSNPKEITLDSMLEKWCEENNINMVKMIDRWSKWKKEK